MRRSGHYAQAYLAPALSGNLGHRARFSQDQPLRYVAAPTGRAA
jgi:hypothetical protein